MKKNDHISIYESGIKSIQIFGENIYGCTPSEIIIVDKENQIQTIAYSHEEIYRLTTDGSQIFGKDMYGGTYQISKSKITKLTDYIVDFHSQGIRRIKKNENYLLFKDEKELINLGSNKIKEYLIFNELGVFVYRKGIKEEEIVLIDMSTNEEVWRTKLELEESRIQQLLSIEENHIYLISYNGNLHRISMDYGILDIGYSKNIKTKISNIPLAKLDESRKWLIHPQKEINISEEVFFSRKLENGILDNGIERLELFYGVSDYTFDEEDIYFQIHTYPDHNNKENTSQIIQIQRGTNNIKSRFLVNPWKKSLDAKQLLIMGNDIVILDVHGKLMKKKIKYKT